MAQYQWRNTYSAIPMAQYLWRNTCGAIPMAQYIWRNTLCVLPRYCKANTRLSNQRNTHTTVLSMRTLLPTVSACILPTVAILPATLLDGHGHLSQCCHHCLVQFIFDVTKSFTGLSHNVKGEVVAENVLRAIRGFSCLCGLVQSPVDLCASCMRNTEYLHALSA